MFAVIKTGGKQYKVAKNDVIKVEKLDGEQGATIILDQVLAFSDGKKITLGAPLVKDVTVSAEVLEQKKDDKVIIFKKKRRHNYRRKKGHRQEVAFLRIQDIGTGLKAKAAPKADAKKPAVKADTAKKETAKAAPKKAPVKKVDAATAKAPAKKAPAKKPEAKKTTEKK